MDFATSYDFYQVYSQRLSENLKLIFKVSDKFYLSKQINQIITHNKEEIKYLIEYLNEISLLLIKMSIQSLDFS